MNSKILIIDTMNLLHRARSGFASGEHSIAFNFIRSLRALVEQFDPSRIVMALEGHPQFRHDALPEYKANRRVEHGSEKARALQDFFRQKDEVLDLVGSKFPVCLVRHPDYEADDTVANIVKHGSTAIKYVIVSSDTDYTQLVDRPNVQVFNPVKKSFLEWPSEVDYCVFKALKGDATDNIPGVPGVGEKTAMKLAHKGMSVDKFFDALKKSGIDYASIYERNLKLVAFSNWSDDEMLKMTSTLPTRDWDVVRKTFEDWQFESLLKDKTWDKLVKTFDPLFGE